MKTIALPHFLVGSNSPKDSTTNRYNYCSCYEEISFGGGFNLPVYFYYLVFFSHKSPPRCLGMKNLYPKIEASQTRKIDHEYTLEPEGLKCKPDGIKRMNVTIIANRYDSMVTEAKD